jgi:peptidyl-prolyl cis-trans isomerase C
VVTIDGLCDAKNAKGECKTTMTRAQFDKLADAFFGDQPDQTPIAPQQKRRLATQLVHNTIYSKLAEKQGLDKTPDYQQLMSLVRLNVLAELERRSIQKKNEPTAEDVEKFYNDNQERYTEMAFNRLTIPLHGGADNKMTEADLKKLADDMHQRVVTGADFKTLQAEVYDKVGLKNPPDTKATLHPNEVPASQQAIKQLKPGEISDVIKDGNGFFIFKLDSKKISPLDDKLKADIRKTLTPQKFKKAMDDIDASAKADYSTDYFGPPPPTGPPMRPPMTPPAGGPKPPGAGQPGAPGAHAGGPGMPPPAAPGKPGAPAAPPAAPPQSK